MMVYVLELGILSCRGYLHILHPHFEARYTNSSTEQNIKKNTKQIQKKHVGLSENSVYSQWNSHLKPG